MLFFLSFSSFRIAEEIVVILLSRYADYDFIYTKNKMKKTILINKPISKI
jgi:hypothetical protein